MFGISRDQRSPARRIFRHSVCVQEWIFRGSGLDGEPELGCLGSPLDR